MRYRDQLTCWGWRCHTCGKVTTYTRRITHREAHRWWWVHTRGHRPGRLTLTIADPRGAPRTASRPSL